LFAPTLFGSFNYKGASLFSLTFSTSTITIEFSYITKAAILLTSVIFVSIEAIFVSIEVIFISIEASLSSSLLSILPKEPIFRDYKAGIFFSIAASLSSSNLSAEFPIAKAATSIIITTRGTTKFPSPFSIN
jgi:hypothetical protein